MIKEYNNELKDIRESLRTKGKPADLYVRTSQQAMQIALIVAAGKHKDEQIIDVDSLQYGIDLTRYLSNNMQYIAENFISKNYQDSLIKKALNIIKASGEKGLTQRDITRKLQFMSRNQRKDILNDLLDSGQIESIVITEESKRPKSIYKAK